ncbi:MAG: hypothetical protein AAF732_18745, partial [Pseudomonadota bacterium]
ARARRNAPGRVRGLGIFLAGYPARVGYRSRAVPAVRPGPPRGRRNAAGSVRGLKQCSTAKPRTSRERANSAN